MSAVWRCMCMLLPALLASCGRLPNTAIPESLSEQHFGAFNAATPIVALVKQRGVRPLDPASHVPLLDQTLHELRKTDPDRRFAGITYSLTRTNALDADWLVQTPDVWGCRATASPSPARPEGRDCAGRADALVERIHGLLAQAKQTVDIAVLQPHPDGRFLAALRDAVTALGRSGRQVRVRVVVGHYPLTGVDPKAMLVELTRDLIALPGSTVTLEAASVRSCAGESGCGSYSWNHAKIIAADRRVALVGGHNLWARDYLADSPVHDLSMQVRGPAASDAAGFVDALWRFACASAGNAPGVAVAHLAAGQRGVSDGCPPDPTRRRATTSAGVTAGVVPILAVGRLGSGITHDFANQSDLARDLLLGAARRSIRIVQQDLAFMMGRLDPLYPESTLERMADFLLTDKGDLHIVLSDPKAVGNSGSSYGNGVSLEVIAHKIRQVARARSGLSDAALDSLLCRRLFLAPFRFGPDAMWPGGKPIGNHAKFWMVDDRVFYIGSDNFYPVDLQEFGYIVDHRAAAADVLRAYWTPLWSWSRRAAITGADAPRCIFATGGR